MAAKDAAYTLDETFSERLAVEIYGRNLKQQIALTADSDNSVGRLTRPALSTGGRAKSKFLSVSVQFINKRTML